MIQSMTGFCSVEGSVGSSKIRVEIKSLNHRFLDLKIRIPREFGSAEHPIRAAIQNRFPRGAIDVKIEKISDQGSTQGQFHLNFDLAKNYYQSLCSLQQALGLKDSIRAHELATLPEVISRVNPELSVEEAWKQLEPLVHNAIQKLWEMRKHEGEHLKKSLLHSLEHLRASEKRLRLRREECQSIYTQKIRERVKTIFESHPMALSPHLGSESFTATIQSIMENRIIQELALLCDRTDIEEELIRFNGHLSHFEKVLAEGGQVGRKLDFLIQELNREINTLGNKAQDYSINEEVVLIKVRLEQLREQVMNFE